MKDLEEYKRLSLRTARSEFNITNPELLHAAMGVAGEAGELIDAVKKHMIYGGELNEMNVKEELGDLLWFIALAINSMGWTFDEVTDVNIAKLAARYPDKFTTENAINRDLDAEDRAMAIKFARDFNKKREQTELFNKNHVLSSDKQIREMQLKASKELKEKYGEGFTKLRSLI